MAGSPLAQPGSDSLPSPGGRPVVPSPLTPLRSQPSSPLPAVCPPIARPLPAGLPLPLALPLAPPLARPVGPPRPLPGVGIALRVGTVIPVAAGACGRLLCPPAVLAARRSAVAPSSLVASSSRGLFLQLASVACILVPLVAVPVLAAPLAATESPCASAPCSPLVAAAVAALCPPCASATVAVAFVVSSAGV